MIKVLFLINTLRGGGAERVLVNLVNNMDRTRFDITVKTMFDGGVNRERLNPDIRYICRKAPLLRGIAQIFRFFSSRKLYQYFIGDEHYDVLIAYMHGAPTKVISGCPDKNVKKITWLHTGDPKNSTFFKFWFRNKDAFAAYSSYDAIVGVSRTVLEAFRDYSGLKNNLHVVYNTNDTNWILRCSEEYVDLQNRKNIPLICSVGRIGSEKGYDRLINAVVLLNKKGVLCDLAIVGDGKDMNALKCQIHDNKADDYIHLLGFQINPYPIVKQSDLFICSSRTEGLSTAVSEALILGVPVVSTDVSGARELLGENNEYGLVVENSEQGIYDGLKAMLTDTLLKHYRQKVIERAPFFYTGRTVKMAEELIDNVLEK